MIPEIGHFALILALCMALFQATFPLIGASSGNRAWIHAARPIAQGQFIFMVVAFSSLTYAFISNDFSVLYVSMHSNSELPLLYRIAGVWGGHEGSLLLWALMLSGWTIAVSLFSKGLPDEMVARVLSIMGFIAIGFHLFMLLTSNPFERQIPVPMDGNDLNPLLQDIGLVIHPPMLYMGYVGFSVAFAFAIAALLDGKLDATWARWSRPWTTVAWAILTCGIALGSWWAYYELGWGGWWFWDPVENASFMPWLVGTALLHSLAVTEKRGAFKSWTVLLAIAAFSLSLLGTFLVRSGVLTSVHAFATDPERGLFILAFLAIVVGSSLTLYAIRAPKVGLGGRFSLISRESALLGNNIFMTVAAATVLLGTIYPLIVDALGLGKISVGPPYFDNVFVPLMAPALMILGLGTIARWKQDDLGDILRKVKIPFILSTLGSIIVPFLLGHWSFMINLGLFLAFWIFTTTANALAKRLQQYTGMTLVQRLSRLTRSYLGMHLAHFGVGVFIIGVTLVKGYELEQDVRMEVGDTKTVAGYTFQFDGAFPSKGPNYQASIGVISVFKGGKKLLELNPEKRVYNVQRNPMTEAGIDSGFLRHLYVSLGEQLGGGAWSVRIYYKPFVGWIWLGCLLMALGGILAISDKRYRLARRHDHAVNSDRAMSQNPPEPTTTHARNSL